MNSTKCNKKIGNSFEEEFCELLATNGFWAHNMAQKAVGQPADVIAVMNNKAILIDCKVCSKDVFQISRIESNQEAAMRLWLERGNELCYFALKLFDGNIYMIPFEQIADRKTDIPKVEIWTFLSFNEWVKVMKCLLK